MKPPRGLVGVLHLPALPGDPRPAGDFRAAEAHALRDAERLAEAGFDALIVENFGSAPFPKGTAGHRLPPHQVAFMALVVRAAAERTGLPIGVNCLRNDALAALGIAAATGAAFVRVNVHTGAYVTDQGLIEGEADVSLRYRAQLGAEVALLADVLVKHASPLAPLGAEQAAEEALDRGGAEGIVVTGRGTGQPVDPELLAEARRGAGERPVWIGSGLVPETASTLAPLADAAIVGTFTKEGGDVRAPVDPSRARHIVEAARGRFRPVPGGPDDPPREGASS
ncbi:MAG TPA: BtpA/SgcQ family protein [Polyangiaceae bacterium LLY-WYZ-15_(1-7)]|nr:phosphorybosylanthranilate isomerase [Myxococcales bacterium]MAT29464.1 phosphorybosylanthranilate isomerase [Sandaracinus sp.]HJK90490.1 BtpA/SgcQ family protein [Polyangiaceae bacterium LLY-WYZ-15_(1-7)]HJL02106.1 BtpA/SgcQ family protein [Polyangiaceae bacterium LLY-WYZ-15_(1-7)]HJL11902.1 BtpA/SgcQ family protein [Polyangiaceae bacterium LLY-WYZ-15_(1-7)]